MKRIFVHLLLVFLIGCKDRPTTIQQPKVAWYPKYAKGFWMEDMGHFKNLYVRQSTDSNSSLIKYKLVSRGRKSSNDSVNVIEVPIASIVCTSTTHIPLLDYLGESDKLTGFPSTSYISSTTMRKRIDGGQVKELGSESGINLEVLLQLRPTMVMTYSLASDLGALKKAQELGIPVVVNAEFLEHHPLGRAEWIKFMALFMGKEEKADSVFSWIEKEYLTARQQVDTTGLPTVLTGIPYGGTWFLPGGQNYGAQFFKDAGLKYLWADDRTNGFLKLSLESVFEKALKADYWIGVGSFESYAELKATDGRFAKFAAFQNRKVYNYGKRIGPTGGNEYLELGYLRPDLILKDLIQITHPSQYPNPNLFFYQVLK